VVRHQRVQGLDPRHAPREPAPCEPPTLPVFDLHVVMVLGPVIPNKQHRRSHLSFAWQQAREHGEDQATYWISAHPARHPCSNAQRLGGTALIDPVERPSSTKFAGLTFIPVRKVRIALRPA